MSIVQVIPGSATSPWGGELDERGNRRYRETWVVLTDDPSDGPQVVGDAPGVPRLYSAYRRGNDIDLGATLKSNKPERRADTLTVWDINLEWDSALQAPDQGAKDPVARRRKKKWSAIGYEQPVVHDVGGAPIMNVVGDEFDPPAMRTAHGLRLVYTRNLADESEVGFAFSYLNAVNQDNFQGFLPGTCCCVDVDSEEDFDNGVFFWPTTLTFEFRRIIINPQCKVHEVINGVPRAQRTDRIYPWNLTLENVGLSERIGIDKRRILGTDTKPVPQPVRLDITGEHLRFDASSEDTVFLTWQIFESKPFMPLGII